MQAEWGSSTCQINNYVSHLVPDPDISIIKIPYEEDIILFCIISYPTSIQSFIDVPTQAMVQWIKDGDIINDGTVEPNDDIYASILILSNADPSNTGMYNCKAVVGSNTGSVYIMNSNEVNAVESITIMPG